MVNDPQTSSSTSKPILVPSAYFGKEGPPQPLPSGGVRRDYRWLGHSSDFPASALNIAEQFCRALEWQSGSTASVWPPVFGSQPLGEGKGRLMARILDLGRDADDRPHLMRVELVWLDPARDAALDANRLLYLTSPSAWPKPVPPHQLNPSHPLALLFEPTSTSNQTDLPKDSNSTHDTNQRRLMFLCGIAWRDQPFLIGTDLRHLSVTSETIPHRYHDLTEPLKDWHPLHSVSPPPPPQPASDHRFPGIGIIRDVSIIITMAILLYASFYFYQDSTDKERLIDDLSRKYLMLQSDLIKASQTITSLKESLDQRNEDNQRLRADLTDFKRQISERDRRINDLKSQLDTAGLEQFQRRQDARERLSKMLQDQFEQTAQKIIEESLQKLSTNQEFKRLVKEALGESLN
ncbi:hypothetical protein Isop_2627 [Isosphaera pallida ATCC 43644]|uniref:Uncharacterized protein n=2 Tax=Isosphaera pallida TaxID=128 RepID=E8QZ55_ISOPI|nr:hypothetical protein Isop_2627 [Isosphaera pallida ATCC 43644]